jgi:RAB protein geranylgeranyltransferase component A
VFSLTEFVDWVKTRNEQKPASEHVDLSFPASNSSDSSTSASTFTSSSTPELPAELVRIARQYNISLCPTIVPSIGPFVSSLVRSGVAKYSSFKLIDVVALYEDGKLKPAATTKEEIFKDKTMSLVEKRRLMKFVMAANSDAEDGPFGKQAEGEYVESLICTRQVILLSN